jgi:hypothetical protein
LVCVIFLFALLYWDQMKDQIYLLNPYPFLLFFYLLIFIFVFE